MGLFDRVEARPRARRQRRLRQAPSSSRCSPSRSPAPSAGPWTTASPSRPRPQPSCPTSSPSSSHRATTTASAAPTTSSRSTSSPPPRSTADGQRYQPGRHRSTSSSRSRRPRDRRLPDPPVEGLEAAGPPGPGRSDAVRPHQQPDRSVRPRCRARRSRRAGSGAAGARAAAAVAGSARGDGAPAARRRARRDRPGTAPPAPAAPKRVNPADRPWLDVDGERYPLMGAITILGRDDCADIILDDPGISRRHSEIRVTTDGPHLVTQHPRPRLDQRHLRQRRADLQQHGSRTATGSPWAAPTSPSGPAGVTPE